MAHTSDGTNIDLEIEIPSYQVQPARPFDRAMRGGIDVTTSMPNLSQDKLSSVLRAVNRYSPYKDRRLLDYLAQRRYLPQGNESTLPRLVKNHQPFLDRLNFMKKLPVHDGCVNTICWNKTGEYILSGSDDCNLCITKPTYLFDESKDYTVLHKVQTRHLGNIFGAQFIPNSCDSLLVSCSSEGPVIVHDINSTDPSLGLLTFNCHSSTVFEVVTLPDDDNVFLSCSQDKTVRLFDMRCHKSCTRTSTCPHRHFIRNSYPVTTLTVHPINSNLLLVGRGDGIGLVYDRRKLPDVTQFSREAAHQERLDALADGVENHTNRFNSYIHPLEGVVSKFMVPNMEDKNRFTSLCFSPDGSEVLASYSGDYIYLFNHDRSSNFELIQTLPKIMCSDDNNDDNNNAGSSLTNSSRIGNRTRLSDRSRQRSPRMPRIRVRGDWSDLGINSVPSSAQSEEVNAHFLQRIAQVAFTFGSARSQRVGALTRVIAGPIDATPASDDSSTAPSEDRETIDDDEDEEENEEEDECPDADEDDDGGVVYLTESEDDNHNHSHLPQEESQDPRCPGSRIGGADDSQSKQQEVSQETKMKFKKTFADLKLKYTNIPTYNPKVKYQGHRNCRTSVKEAIFWGDEYIMSGSDCGRVVVWDKKTAKLLMAFPADERVVNSLAPNPHYFALATSGIDYDIKLWSTQGVHEGPLRISSKAMESIVRNNEAMLEESKQTISVPPHLFFRVIASLARER